jgi:hypothetical protein
MVCVRVVGIAGLFCRAFAIVAAVLLLATAPAMAADLGTPQLSEPLGARNFFDPERLLTTGGVKYEAVRSFSLEPEVGVGHEKREQEITGGYEEVVHKVHARAGGKLSLTNVLYFSAAAKLPVYTYELANRRLGSDLSFQAPLSRQDYDLVRRPGMNMGWSSEAGFRLGGGTELTIFYDQTPFAGVQGGSRPDSTEERFGTRFILHFR